ERLRGAGERGLSNGAIEERTLVRSPPTMCYIRNDFRVRPQSVRSARRWVTSASIALLLSALSASVASAGPLQDDLKARRSHTMERLGPDALAIFWSAPARVYSTDVNYEYRQESNLLYLTGIDQEDTLL